MRSSEHVTKVLFMPVVTGNRCVTFLFFLKREKKSTFEKGHIQGIISDSAKLLGGRIKKLQVYEIIRTFAIVRKQQRSVTGAGEL